MLDPIQTIVIDSYFVKLKLDTIVNIFTHTLFFYEDKNVGKKEYAYL